MSRTAPAPPLRIYFDLSGEDAWHRREWETALAALAPALDAVRCDSIEGADCVVVTHSAFHFNAGGRVFGRSAIDETNRPPRFVWDHRDLPAGRDPGFYCSLPRPLFDPRRHRTFCYPLRYNECIEPFDLADATHLYGFVGGITSGLRSRLLTTLRRVGNPAEMLLVEQGGPWAQMFDRSGVPAKQRYAESLRRSRFFLCPRGNGVSSVRLFETMQAARVPVILSDDFVPPAGIDWEACAVRIAESDLARIPALLAARRDDWPRLALNARRTWEENFSDAALLGTLGRELRVLLATGARSGWRDTARRTLYWVRQRSRRSLGALRSKRLFA